MKEIEKLLLQVYSPTQVSLLVDGITDLYEKYSNINKSNINLSEKDVVLITYGDQLSCDNESKLKTLNKLLIENLKDEISIVHILPFYPYSSDDGFSVIDYYSVNEEIGNWEDIKNLSNNFKLIFDAVINHSSQHCKWFKEFLNENEDFKDFYVELENNKRYTNVTRPRTSPLSHSYKSKFGFKEIWTTFSEDQVDLNYKNPKLLLQIIDLLMFYISKGANIIRLDAVGFIWKEEDTECIHLPQAHLIIKAIRNIIDKLQTSTLLLSETNVPHEENISYFGNGDEAHMVYNFALPPLVAYSLLSGNTKQFIQWAKTLKLKEDNICYYNFLASHDGIGLRPVDDILTTSETQIIINAAEANGGKISYKQNPDGNKSPYEINCNFLSLLKGNEKDEALGIKRIILAHAILLAMPGLPAIYFHSIFGSENFLSGMLESGINRRINREKFTYNYLSDILSNSESREMQVLSSIKKLIQIRRNEELFNPYNNFEIQDSENGTFIIKRTSNKSDLQITAIFNLSDSKKRVDLSESNYKNIFNGDLYHSSVELSSLDFVFLKS